MQGAWKVQKRNKNQRLDIFYITIPTKDERIFVKYLLVVYDKKEKN